MSYFDDDIITNEVRKSVSFKKLWEYGKPVATTFYLALSIILASSGMAIYAALGLGHFVESAKAGDQSGLYYWAGIILLFELGHILAYWFGRRLLAKASTETIFNLRQKVFSHMHELTITYYDQTPEGRTVTRMTHDIEGLDEFFASGLGRLVSALGTFVAAGVAMVMTDWKLGLTILLCFIPSALLTYWTRNKVRHINREMSKNNGYCNAQLSELIRGASTLRSMGLLDWSKKHYDEVVDKHLDSQLTANSYYAWSRPIINWLCYLPTVFLLFVGGPKVIAGSLSLGLFVALMRACDRFTHPMITLTREIHQIQQAFTSAERITSFLMGETEDSTLGAQGNVKKSLRGEIAFDNVSMAYSNGETVLKNVSFSIRPGEHLGIVGTTGSGKTTILSLLARLYPFQEGHILYDGVPIEKYDRAHLRSQIGMVTQKVIIFQGSVEENIRCGIHRTTSMENFLENNEIGKVLLGNGLSPKTMLLENGENLSVGEKQLISLARVMWQNPSLLIFDEATGNIDLEIEESILRQIDQMQTTTRITVAHRPSTFARCDRLLVFDQGRLLENGPMQQLRQQKGHLANLLQMGT